MQSTQLDERALIVSSDGHAVADMPAYLPYVPSRYHDEFDAFCDIYKRDGMRLGDPRHLSQRTDPDVVADWRKSVIETHRLEGRSDPVKRFVELDGQGVAAEVLFPDLGLPFDLFLPFDAGIRGYTRPPELFDVGNRAHNRWLADFCSTAPNRFVGLAVLSFDDVEATVAEIRQAKKNGLRGFVLPMADDDRPFFHESFEPIWNVLEELEMPVVGHPALSSTTNRSLVRPAPHPASQLALMSAQTFFHCQQILPHFIWGGVLERHPKLQLVLTEMGSGWVISALANMDYSWEGGYLRRDIRDFLPHKPSEYFRRQVHLGSSLFSLAEAKARHEIGVDKMMVGVDYPHHEGTWAAGPGTRAYLRATLGEAGVSPEEARLMVGGNAVGLWDLDRGQLQKLADVIGPTIQEILVPPAEEYYPRGDVHKPLTSVF
jgi:predicted TIM-barrel fold metal-dependent hydrolase